MVAMALPSRFGYDICMGEMLGYMLSWTMYGTWLQGNEKGFVKDGVVRGENPVLRRSNKQNLEGPIVRLSRKEKGIVREAIITAGEKYGQRILAVSVQSNHVHVVCDYIEVPIGVMVARYKSAGRSALGREGRTGRTWTKGYDKRFCFDEAALRSRIKYVEGHGE